MMLRLADDRDWIAGGLNDIVARGLFSAGLDLEAARALIGEHHAAAGSSTPSTSWRWRSGTSGTWCSVPAGRVRLSLGSRVRALRVLPAAVQGDGCLGCWRAIGRGPGPVRSRLAGAAQDQEQG